MAVPWWAIGTSPNQTFASGTQQAPNRATAVKDAQGYGGFVLAGPFKTQNQAITWTKPKSGGGGGKGGGTSGSKNQIPSGAHIVALARSWLGVPYVFGGTTRSGVDCSGLVMNVAQEAGVKNCPRTSEEQWAWCEKINQSDANAGDLVFFVGAPEEAGPPGHVGIIVAPGVMINAPFPGTVVRQDHYVQGPPDQNSSNSNNLWGYGRLRGVAGSTSANPYQKQTGVVPVPVGGGSFALVLIAAAIVIGIVILLLASGIMYGKAM